VILAGTFWLSVGVVGYAYAGYPLFAAAMARRYGSAPAGRPIHPPLTVVIAAYNEAGRIGDRVRDILAQDYPAENLSVLVVSDGSRDGTAAAADVGDPRVRVLTLEQNGGKAMAINAAMAAVDTPFVAFADARQRYGRGALRALVAPFADPEVGAVSGELMIADTGGSDAAGVGLYWRMEKRLREDEARLGWLHGVSGAVYALRTEAFRALPRGTILDDMWVPLQVALAGKRVWMARDAFAYDQASSESGEEFRRKLRTLAGNWQLIGRLPAVLDPVNNPVFFAWFSHKFLRLVVPWALLLAFAASALAWGWFYRVALIAQLAAYAAAAVAVFLPRIAKRIPLLPAAGTFVMLNAAALLSLPAALAWDPSRLWKKH
jgi:poly-beta-1,6-N-acetyl-D-glucosamine synthase